MIGQYLQEQNQTKLLKRYNLQEFGLNVLDKKQTLLEKLVSLVRFSFYSNPVIPLSEKIRHFYDLYFLANDKECKEYIHSNDFLEEFNKILEHDKKTFNEPEGWNKKEIKVSPIINDFDNLWEKLKQRYLDELSVLAFTEIPSESEIYDNFKELTAIIESGIGGN